MQDNHSEVCQTCGNHLPQEASHRATPDETGNSQGSSDPDVIVLVPLEPSDPGVVIKSR